MEEKQMIMKKALLFILTVTISVITYAQTSNTEKIKWGVFASATCNRDDMSVENMKQDFIDVIQNANRYYWGKDNYYTLYNKKETHSGFMTYTTYDFVDKYSQRGLFIYQYNRNADWLTKHMFYIFYEGQTQGMLYCSRAPETN